LSYLSGLFFAFIENLYFNIPKVNFNEKETCIEKLK